MGDFSLDAILNMVNNAIAAVKTANDAIETYKDTKVVITTSTTQDEVDAALAKLRAEYDTLHERVQNKLRGS